MSEDIVNIERIIYAFELTEIWTNYAGGKQIGISHKKSDKDYILVFIPERDNAYNVSHISIQSECFDLCARNLWKMLEDYTLEVSRRIPDVSLNTWNLNSYLIYLYLNAPKLRSDVIKFDEIKKLLLESFCPQIAFDFFSSKARAGLEKMDSFNNSVNVRELLFLTRNVLAKKSLTDNAKLIPSTGIVDLLETVMIPDYIRKEILELMEKYSCQDTNKFKQTTSQDYSNWIKEGVLFEYKFNTNYKDICAILSEGKRNLVQRFV